MKDVKKDAHIETKSSENTEASVDEGRRRALARLGLAAAAAYAVPALIPLTDAKAESSGGDDNGGGDSSSSGPSSSNDNSSSSSPSNSGSGDDTGSTDQSATTLPTEPTEPSDSSSSSQS